jgi:hypothetical protein
MKKIYPLIFIIVIFISCDKYPNPGVETLESLQIQTLGSNQIGKLGEYLNDSVGVIINNNTLEFAKNSAVTAFVEVVSGGGSVDNPVLHINDKGRLLTRWKMGDETSEQKLLITIKTSEGKELIKTEIKSTVYFSNKWNKITSGYFTGITDMVTDTINNRSMMIVHCALYESGENFHDWKLIENNNDYNCLYEIEVDSHGNVYGADRRGALYKSDDWGRSWENLGKPIDNNNQFFYLSITKDDYIWATKWNYGVRCSTNGGHNWQKDTIGLVEHDYLGGVYKFGDSHIVLSKSQGRILQTFDNGITWNIINSNYFTGLYVTPQKEIITYNSNMGRTLYKSVDNGLSFSEVLSVNASYAVWPTQHVFCWGNNSYFVVTPGAVYQTKDFENFNKIKSIEKQSNIFIDHRGTIYINGSSKNAVYILPQNSNKQIHN